MTVCEVNKRKVRQFFDEVLNGGRVELVDELVAKDFIGVLGCAPGTVTGPEGVRRFVSERRAARPDLYIKIEDQIAEDDRVVTRWRAISDARRSSPLADSVVPGEGWAGITIIRLLAGKQVDAHTQCARSSGDRAPGRSTTDRPDNLPAGTPGYGETVTRR